MSRAASPVDGHLAGDALPIRPKPTPLYRVVRAILKPVLMHAIFRVRVIGRENVPAGTYVAIANHLDGIDPVLIAAGLPPAPRLHIVGDPAGLIPQRVRWWFVRKMGGLIPVDRRIKGDQQVRDQVLKALASGCPTLIFPEAGTGDHEGTTMPFRKGFAHFAVQTGLPVVPIGITGTKAKWWLKRITVKVGVPFEAASRTVDEITADGQARVEALLVADVRRSALTARMHRDRRGSHAGAGVV